MLGRSKRLDFELTLVGPFFKFETTFFKFNYKFRIHKSNQKLLNDSSNYLSRFVGCMKAMNSHISTLCLTKRKLTKANKSANIYILIANITWTKHKMKLVSNSNQPMRCLPLCQIQCAAFITLQNPSDRYLISFE